MDSPRSPPSPPEREAGTPASAPKTPKRRPGPLTFGQALQQDNAEQQRTPFDTESPSFVHAGGLDVVYSAQRAAPPRAKPYLLVHERTPEQPSRRKRIFSRVLGEHGDKNVKLPAATAEFQKGASNRFEIDRRPTSVATTVNSSLCHRSFQGSAKHPIQHVSGAVPSQIKNIPPGVDLSIATQDLSSSGYYLYKMAVSVQLYVQPVPALPPDREVTWSGQALDVQIVLGGLFGCKLHMVEGHTDLYVLDINRKHDMLVSLWVPERLHRATHDSSDSNESIDSKIDNAVHAWQAAAILNKAQVLDIGGPGGADGAAPSSLLYVNAFYGVPSKINVVKGELPPITEACVRPHYHIKLLPLKEEEVEDQSNIPILDRCESMTAHRFQTPPIAETHPKKPGPSEWMNKARRPSIWSKRSKSGHHAGPSIPEESSTTPDAQPSLGLEDPFTEGRDFADESLRTLSTDHFGTDSSDITALPQLPATSSRQTTDSWGYLPPLPGTPDPLLVRHDPLLIQYASHIANRLNEVRGFRSSSGSSIPAAALGPRTDRSISDSTYRSIPGPVPSPRALRPARHSTAAMYNPHNQSNETIVHHRTPVPAPASADHDEASTPQPDPAGRIMGAVRSVSSGHRRTPAVSFSQRLSIEAPDVAARATAIFEEARRNNRYLRPESTIELAREFEAADEAAAMAQLPDRTIYQPVLMRYARRAGVTSVEVVGQGPLLGQDGEEVGNQTEGEVLLPCDP